MDDSRRRPALVLLEGNIGAGKTTLGKRLADSGRYTFLEEPVRSWKQGFEDDLLSLFYGEPKRWAFSFQLAAFTTRLMQWQEALREPGRLPLVLERSVYCDRHVFARNCYEQGLMTPTEWQLYCRLWDWVCPRQFAETSTIVYVRTPVESCRERILRRGRAEETGIPPSYLSALERLHDDWLLSTPGVVVLDGTLEWSPEAVDERLREAAEARSSGQALDQLERAPAQTAVAA